MFDTVFTQINLMLLIVAVIFTAVGWYFGKKDQVTDIVAATIDSLIEDGYLKTRGVGREMEILKHTEWCKKDFDI